MIEIEIDGSRFDSVQGFYAELNRHLSPDSSIGAHCLDSLNDVLRDCFGDPSLGYLIHWRNSGESRERLGYSETIRQLETRLRECHPDSRAFVEGKLADAKRGRGATAFEWLVEIIRDHEHIHLELS